MTDSIWGADVKLPRFSQLEGNLSTDVLVIGGGGAGVHTQEEARQQAHNESDGNPAGGMQPARQARGNIQSVTAARLLHLGGGPRFKGYNDCFRLPGQRLGAAQLFTIGCYGLGKSGGGTCVCEVRA